MKAPALPQRDPVPTGTHQAICYCVADLGTHEIAYPGQEAQDVRQLLIQWELPQCRIDIERENETVNLPRVIGMTYTFSSYKKSNLAQHVTSWTGGCGDDFDYESLVGKECLLSVVHQESKTSGKVYAKIAGVMQMPAGMSNIALENSTIYFSIDEHGKELPKSLLGKQYKWIREQIEDSLEFKGMANAAEAIKNPQPRSDEDGPLLDSGEDYDAENPDDIPY